jgi:hypothetical protein
VVFLGLRCQECGGIMESFENFVYNYSYTVKKDSWRCCRCHRVVEKARPIEGFEYR